jgi:2-octaprenylphenol hydroxylase
MKRTCEITIVGAGMVGLATAALIARSGQRDRFRVTVIDGTARPAFDPEGEVALRVSALAPGSVDILADVGAWESIAAKRACPFREMRVWDAGGSPDGPEALCFEAAEFAVAELGFITENVLVRSELIDVLDSAGVETRFETPIDGIERDHRRFDVRLTGGEVLTPDLLVAADGARSLIREQAGIGVTVWRHNQKAFVTHLCSEKPHRHRAWQRFLPDGPIGMLPLGDGRISVVWSTTAEQADRALELADADLSDLLTEITGKAFGRLTVAGPRGAFPLNSQHAERYVMPGLVLIGDAAHSIHPLAGQGANLGLADAAVLAGVLGAAVQHDEYIGDLPVLRRYERARKGANLSMLRFMDALNRLYSNESAALGRLRGIGMYLFNRSGPVRDAAVQRALGVR